MNHSDYNIGTQPDNADIYSSGIAYVVIPVDVDRAKYVAECYKTSTVSIYSEHIGFKNRVPIDKYSINFIVFPQATNEFGSAVSFKSEPLSKKPIIDGLYFREDELCDLSENMFKFKRELGENAVEIAGSPDGKFLTLNVAADKAGEIQINVKSKDESGKVSINVDGACEITSLTDTTLKQYGKLSFITANMQNETENTFEEHTSRGRNIYSSQEMLDADDYLINSTKMALNTSSYLINNGKENFVLGQKLKSFLDKLINEISSITITTDNGPAPILNKAQILTYKEQTASLLSEVGFIDK